MHSAAITGTVLANAHHGHALLLWAALMLCGTLFLYRRS
jgi:hypothetical protein